MVGIRDFRGSEARKRAESHSEAVDSPSEMGNEGIARRGSGGRGMVVLSFRLTASPLEAESESRNR